MGIIIIAILVTLLVMGITFTVSDQYGRGTKWGRIKEKVLDAVFAGVVSTVICVIIIGLVSLGTVLSSVDSRNKLDVTYTENLTEYKQAVDMTYNGIQGIDPAAPLSFENATQIQAYERAVADYRNAVVDFNEKLKTHTYWQDNWFIGVIWVDVSGDLGYVSITD